MRSAPYLEIDCTLMRVYKNKCSFDLVKRINVKNCECEYMCCKIVRNIGKVIKSQASTDYHYRMFCSCSILKEFCQNFEINFVS